MENVEEEALFVDENGAPLRFYLHKSIKQPGARIALETKIQRYGGEINDMDLGSNVILVNPDHPSGDLDKIRHAYKTHPDPELGRVHVEAMSWVKNCVKTGKCIHYFFQKGMGGAVRNRDRVRTAFSEEDDYHLVEYLATLIPDKSHGGRQGNNIYKSLMENHEALPEEYGWVLRHTWQSWRERYKKRQEWFDERITELAAELKPTPHQKYHLSRKPARYFATHRAGYEMYREEEEEEEDELEEEEPLRRISGSESPRSADRIQGENEEEDELEEEEALIRKRSLSGSESRRAAKRMRIDSTPPPLLLDDAQDVGAVSKGKEKALPEDDEDVDDGYSSASQNSLFGDAGLFTSPPKPTQATLVGTPPPHDVQTLDSPPVPIESPNVQQPPRQQPARSKRISAARPLDPRPAPRARQTARKVAEVPTPYRSTRAHSTSLEPYVVDINAVTRRNKQKGKKKTLETLEERQVQEEGDNISRGTLSREEGTAETQEVEDFLMDANDHSGISGITEGENTTKDVDVDVDRMPPPRSTARPAVRQPSLETDDRQTDRALRRGHIPVSPVAPSPKDILRSLGGPRLSRQSESITSKASVASPRLAQYSPSDVFGGSRRGGSVQVPSVDFQNPLYAPVAHSAPEVSRKGSRASSTDSFPRHGTRAKEVKQEIKALEKHTPYRPPARTRALEHVVNTR